MNVLNHKLRRELMASKGLILAITSLIALGVMCFIYMRSAYNNLNLAKEDYYIQCRMADFWIEVKKAPLAEITAVAHIPGVSEIRPRIQFFATVDLDRVAEPLNGLVLSLPDRRKPVINDIVLKSGTYFTERRQNEVIVNDAFAREHGLYPGRRIHLILNNRREELEVVGTAISSEFVYLVGPGAIVPDPQHFGVFYIKQTYAEEVFDFDGAANQVLGLLAPEYRDHPDRVLREAERILAPYGVFATIPRRQQASNEFLSNEIKGIGVFSSFLPAIFLSVAAMVLNVLMMRLIEQQRTVIGTLKALGYSNVQVFLHFLWFGIIVGIVGGILGCILGYGMAEFVTTIYRQIFQFPNLENRIYVGLYATSLFISITCAMLGTFYGARAALRLRPAEAMRPKPPARGGRVWIENLSALWSRLSFGWRMVLRNIFRNRLRTAVGIFAAAMGATIISTGLLLHGATQYLIDFSFQKTLRSDVDLVFKDERGADALREAAMLPSVYHAEPRLDVACEFFHGSHRRKGVVTGLKPDAQLTVPRDTSGKPIRVPRVGVAMTRKMAQLLKVSPGDYVIIEPSKGLKRKVAVPVVEIADSYLGLSVYADIDYLSRLIGEELAMNGVQLRVNPDPMAETQFLKEVKQLPALQSYSSRKEMIRSLTDTLIKVQRVFISILIFFAGIIFFCSLLNTSLIGLAERRREVATFRVQGFGAWHVGGYFLRESMVVTVVGTLLGLPLGYFLTYLMSLLYDTDTLRFPMINPLSAFMTTCIFAVVFAIAAHLVVQREIHRTDWREALNVME